MNEKQAPEPGSFHDFIHRVERTVDPYGIGELLLRVQNAWARHPAETTEALGQLARDWQSLMFQGWQRAMGLPTKDAVPAAKDDERFADPAWSEVPALDFLKQYYLLVTRWLENVVYHTPGIAKPARKRAAFWTRQWLNAVAPTNYFLTNPIAVRRFYETGGESLLTGLQNLVKDAQTGDVQMVDKSAFEVGRNLATTPGQVVHRNELVEVIQYAPATEQVYERPLVIITPWINKFYILDLVEKKSMVRWLTRQGFTVFITSWKNPTPQMAETTFDEYMMKGIVETIEVARSITGAKKVNVAGYCIGGTALSATMAWLNREHKRAADVPVEAWTLFATLVDFHRPGDIEVFIDEAGIEAIGRVMDEEGVLGGNELARSFRLLRPNSLIWHYVVHSYLYGEALPAFDVLYWNTDSTRMPRAMHKYYLREFYLHNRLVQKDGVTLAGQPIDLSLIRQPLYYVATEEDHITPWRQVYRMAHIIDAPARFTLASSGHILGIVNPPVKPPKRWYHTGLTQRGQEPRDWLAGQARVDDSWWPDWAAWLGERSGARVAPPPLGNRTYSPVCAAPGTYVREA